jgi:hypothetical protein
MLNRFRENNDDDADTYRLVFLSLTRSLPVYFIVHNAISIHTSKCRKNESNERQRLILSISISFNFFSRDTQHSTAQHNTAVQATNIRPYVFLFFFITI